MAEMGFDTVKLGNISENFSDMCDAFTGKISSIIDSVVAMGNDWQGPTYNTFKTKMETFQSNAFEDIKKQLSDWASKFSDAKTTGEKVQKNMMDTLS